MQGNPEALIDRIYEAAVVPELWENVLVDFARTADCQDSVLIAARGTDFRRWIVSSPDFNELVIAHSTRPEANERTRRLVALQHAGFLRDCDVFQPEEIEADPLYQEFLIPRGYGSGVATLIRAPSGDDIILHGERAGRHGPIAPETVARLDVLRPHFARAALLSTRLNLERAGVTAKALEIIGLPAAVIDGNGRTLAANGIFAALMPDVVQDRPSRLTIVDSAADRLLADAIVRLASGPGELAVSSIPIKARDDRPPIIIHVAPVRGAAHDVFSRGAAILVATPIVPREVPSATVVQGLFDLTPAEAKLAVLIAAGHRPREAAATLSVTTETARTTLKRLLAKTGLRRQADLAALLAGVNLPGGTE